jgi:predicted homoserine dehydrogenase-like protein
MSTLVLRELRARQAQGKPIRVGVAGAGSFGTPLIAQLGRAPGLVPAVVADLDPERARRAWQSAGYDPAAVLMAETTAAAADAVRRGQPVVLPTGELLDDLPLDAVVEATGVIESGVNTAARCLRAGKHVVMVNVEADVATGGALPRLAAGAGVVYTLADGDQPSLICGLVDWAAAIGLEVVAAGKGASQYPLDHPHRIRQESAPGAKVTRVTYMEGTKSQIEMAAAANALGWSVDVPGMHRPSARLAELPTILGRREHGGVLSTTPVVDYANCRSEDGETVIEPLLEHSVFAVFVSDNQDVLRVLRAKGVLMSEDGTRGLLWRPFHLVGVETAYSVAQAALFGLGTAPPPPTPTVEVIAIAKHDLAAGAVLGGMGDGHVRGEAYPAAAVRDRRLLPLGLADQVRLRLPVAAGAALTHDDLVDPGDTICWRLRREFDLLP